MDEENKNNKTGINKVLAGACVLLTIAVIGLGMAYGKAKVQTFEAVSATESESQYQGCCQIGGTSSTDDTKDDITNSTTEGASGSSNGSTITFPFGCH